MTSLNGQVTGAGEHREKVMWAGWLKDWFEHCLWAWAAAAFGTRQQQHQRQHPQGLETSRLVAGEWKQSTQCAVWPATVGLAGDKGPVDSPPRH